MNRFRFKLKNYLLSFRFARNYKNEKIEYPAIIEHLDKKYGKPILVEEFKNLDNWKVTDKTDWGSARPDNLCTLVKENVSIQNHGIYNSLVIRTTPEPAIGKGWDGKEIPRPISSGFVTSLFTISPGHAVSATVNTSDSYLGSWFSFWLYKKDNPGDDRYREIDIFEKIMVRTIHKEYDMCVHGGTKNDRERLAFSFPLFQVNEKNLTFTCELYDHKVRIFVNGIHIYLAEEPDFAGEYHVIFGDGPTTHDGKVQFTDIMNVLPRTFEIKDFRVYENNLEIR